MQAPWPISQKNTPPKYRRKNSCPDGGLNARGKGSHPPDRPGRKTTAGMPSTCTGSATTWPSGPTGFAAATGYPGPAGWTSARPSRLQREDYPSSPRSQPLWPPAPSGTSDRPWKTGATPALKARVPRTKRRTLTGAGSFLAAGSMKEMRYDGKRRMKLPCLGSVKLACTLPKGICYEASIRRENGRWYVCLKLWKPPEPQPERDPKAGGIDTGINPLGTDSDGQTYRNPKASYEVQKNSAGGSGPRPGGRRAPVAGGKPSARSTNATGASGASRNAQHQMTSTVTRKYSDLAIEDLHVAGLMRGRTPRAQADAGNGRHQAAAESTRGSGGHRRGDPGAHVGSPAARPATYAAL